MQSSPTRSMPLGKDNRLRWQVTGDSGGGVAEMVGETYISQSHPAAAESRGLPEKRNPNMKTRVLMATVGGAAAALAAGVMWTAPSVSAGSDFCNSLPTPAQVRDCSCGSDNVPGTQEYQDCLHGN